MASAEGGTPWAGAVGGAAAGTLPEAERADTGLLGADTAVWAVIFAGGIGSRFWPLSSPERPKQLLRLVGDQPLIAESVRRLQPLVPVERVLVMTSADIAAPMHAAIPELPAANLLVEPRPVGTAASLAWAATEVERRGGAGAVMCLLHADLAVGFPDAFRHTLRHAAAVAAREARVVAVGVPATRDEGGFGYLVPGAPLAIDAPLARGGAAAVARFVEKPDPATVVRLRAQGAYWHAGIAVATSGTFRTLLAAYAPDVGAVLTSPPGRVGPALAALAATPSLERALLERVPDLAMVPGDFGWDDVGTWASLRRSRDLDDAGNGAVGAVHFVDAEGNVAHVETGHVVLGGVSGLVVVVTEGLTFVTTAERAAELRPLLERLPDGLRHAPFRAPP